MEKQSGESFSPFDIWQQSGITEHMGGIPATRRLAASCRIAPGQRVLNIGCGTGYTSTSLAAQFHASVTGMDIGATVLQAAQQRLHRAGMRDHVRLLRADAHHLPFPPAAFDVVIAESVLVFCAAGRVLAEIYRVLKPGGSFGSNELTVLETPSAQLTRLMSETLHIHAFEAQDWQALFRAQGFAEVSASVHRVKLWEQLYSHWQVDGLLNYASAFIRGLANPTLRATFVNREMLKAAREFMPCVGYGLYTAVKAR